MLCGVVLLASCASDAGVVSARSGQLLAEGPDRVLQLDDGQRNEADSQTGIRTLSSF